MLVFSMEVFNNLLKHCRSVLQVAPDSSTSQECVHLDTVDVYFRFGGATLASILHGQYKMIKLDHTSQKEKIAQEIHILQALNTRDKGKVPSYLKYRDEGYMYFPQEELVPFLQEVDATVETVWNDKGFHKHGASLVLETTKFVYGETMLKEKFCTVLESCVGFTDTFSNKERYSFCFWAKLTRHFTYATRQF